MAGAFNSNRQGNKDLFVRAQEFEQKKIKIFSKIRNTISTNPLVQMVKGATGKENTNASHSPPQRENPTPINRFLNDGG